MMYIENIVTSAKKITLENHALALTFAQYFFSVPAIHRLVCVQIVFFYMKAIRCCFHWLRRVFSTLKSTTRKGENTKKIKNSGSRKLFIEYSFACSKLAAIGRNPHIACSLRNFARLQRYPFNKLSSSNKVVYSCGPTMNFKICREPHDCLVLQKN